ncbi:hypothetical protein FOCC_FOCC017685 [Frankliniella occidentalis]|nr:hypothetical protein FOCC_FOCC017685 [Frankliniella occidentalis]
MGTAAFSFQPTPLLIDSLVDSASLLVPSRAGRADARPLPLARLARPAHPALGRALPRRRGHLAGVVSALESPTRRSAREGTRDYYWTAGGISATDCTPRATVTGGRMTASLTIISRAIFIVFEAKSSSSYVIVLCCSRRRPVRPPAPRARQAPGGRVRRPALPGLARHPAHGRDPRGRPARGHGRHPEAPARRPRWFARGDQHGGAVLAGPARAAGEHALGRHAQGERGGRLPHSQDLPAAAQEQQGVQSCLPLSHGRRLLNVGAPGALSGAAAGAGAVAYTAARYAVEGATNALRTEMEPLGVSVISLQPPEGATGEALFQPPREGVEHHDVLGSSALRGVEEALLCEKPKPRYQLRERVGLLRTVIGGTRA